MAAFVRTISISLIMKSILFSGTCFALFWISTNRSRVKFPSFYWHPLQIWNGQNTMAWSTSWVRFFRIREYSHLINPIHQQHTQGSIQKEQIRNVIENTRVHRFWNHSCHRRVFALCCGKAAPILIIIAINARNSIQKGSTIHNLFYSSIMSFITKIKSTNIMIIRSQGRRKMKCAINYLFSSSWVIIDICVFLFQKLNNVSYILKVKGNAIFQFIMQIMNKATKKR